MPKALELDPAVMAVTPPVPKAAHISTQPATLRQGRELRKPEEKREPLQVRWPSEDIKAAKLAALQQDFESVSDFMLACFHAYMRTSKHE